MNRIKRGERSDTYLTHVYRLPWSIGSPERTDKKQELSVNTVAFINCRIKVTIMLVDANRVRREVCYEIRLRWLGHMGKINNEECQRG